MTTLRKLVVLVTAGGLMATACGQDSGEPTAAEAGPTEQATGEVFGADVERAAAEESAPAGDLAVAFNWAGFSLLATQPEGENLVFSPASIAHTLLMARAAADEPTAAVIDESLGLPEGMAAHDAWNTLDHALAETMAPAGGSDSEEEQEELVVAIADRIWPRSGVTPSEDWVDLLASHHGVDTQTLDFANDPGGSRQTINQWVSDQTRDLIPELLPEGSVGPETVLVLTDALYFKARWQTVFGKYGTETAPFTRLDGSTVEVELMRELEISDRRGEGDGFVAAEIPYVGDQFSMLLVVPDEGRFTEVRDRLDQDLLDSIDATFEEGPYELLLPRWQGSTQIDLLAWLTELGAAPGAYPAISEEAFLSAAVHGADIEVDEWGTVAAAATAFAFDESGAGQPDTVVRADRPFLYLIRHRPSGLVLFTGQVTDPTPS